MVVATVVLFACNSIAAFVPPISSGDAEYAILGVRDDAFQLPLASPKLSIISVA